MNYKYSSSPFYQHGVATLITSLILLVAMTLVTIFAARSAILEQKIFANVYRANQAFEAASAGLEYGISYVLAEGGADKDDPTDGIDTFALNEDLSNGADYQVVMTYPDSPDTTIVLVSSTGRSDDDSAIRVISQKVVSTPAIPSDPSNPVISRGAVDVDGAGTISNPEGNATIWTGSNTVTFVGSSGKTQIPDPSDPSVLIDSSDSSGIGPDVISGDTSLSSLTGDEFFENFMGLSKTNYKNGPNVREVESAYVNNAYNHGTHPGLDLATTEVLWVDGDASTNGNTTVGCTVSVTGSNVCGTPGNGTIKPVILIIDGNFEGNGTMKVYGVVYVTGNFTGSGNLNVMGSVIVEGDVNGSGSLDVVFNSTVIANAGSDNAVKAALAGSWKDY